MSRVKVLDCTLRDGGYVNNWEFGRKNIRRAVNKITLSNVEIIELGFISSKQIYSEDFTIFNTIDEMSKLIKNNKDGIYVGMINFGEYKLEDIPANNENLIDGIRIVFHKKDRVEALKFAKAVKALGYLTFVQPMVTLRYTDKELIEMIEEVNKINPYAFYIVDSFGVMKRNDLLRLFYLYDQNLNDDIKVGYHSHNNLQLAYSNSQSVLEITTKREIIIDSSTFGMGRGAGNLNTELFLNFLNDFYNANYEITPLLELIDNVLNEIYTSNYWGYSLPHYLSSVNDCHPNYATYLSSKNTLSVQTISKILSTISIEKRDRLDIDYIESLYVEYLSNDINDKAIKKELKSSLKDKKVLLIAPGSSAKEFDFDAYQKDDNTVIISINFNPSFTNVDAIFFSNEKRYERYSKNGNKVDTLKIMTSNIKNIKEDKSAIVNYASLLNDSKKVKDNSGLMLIKLLLSLKVEGVMIVGMDGYLYDDTANYASSDLTLVNSIKETDQLNSEIKKMIKYFDQFLDIKFLTKSKYS